MHGHQQACSWKYICSIPTTCEEARAQLEENYQFLVELHDCYKDLESQSPTDVASAIDSLDSYEGKYHAAQDQLVAYIAANEGPRSSASIAAAVALPPEAAPSSAPKLTACKLLFPTPISKNHSPVQFRFWTGAFRRFYDASSLAHQNVATQQGYLLRAIDKGLGEIIAAKIVPTMKLYGPGGCIELLEEEFRVLYPNLLAKAGILPEQSGCWGEQSWVPASRLYCRRHGRFGFAEQGGPDSLQVHC